MTQAFIDGRYIVTFVGTTNGVVECSSAEHLVSTLRDTYPNPGDKTLAYLLNPANWINDGEDMPWNAETLVIDDDEDYRIAIYRVIEIES